MFEEGGGILDEGYQGNERRVLKCVGAVVCSGKWCPRCDKTLKMWEEWAGRYVTALSRQPLRLRRTGELLAKQTQQRCHISVLPCQEW